jgi:hypothetical protein
MAPTWVNLATIFLLYTTSSAECERGVSVLSLVLTNKRNLMLQKTLEQLMMIKIQGPSLPELDWEAAAVLFFSKKRRRAKVDDKYTKGKVSGYKWGDVYGVESKSEDGEELLEEAKEVEAQELARGESDGEAPMSKQQKAAAKRKKKAAQKEKRALEKAAKKAKNDGIKARIYSGQNPNGFKSVNEEKEREKRERKRERSEKKEADKAAYDALDDEGKRAHDAAAEERKQKKKEERAAKKQKLNDSVKQVSPRKTFNGQSVSHSEQHGQF